MFGAKLGERFTSDSKAALRNLTMVTSIFYRYFQQYKGEFSPILGCEIAGGALRDLRP